MASLYSRVWCRSSTVWFLRLNEAPVAEAVKAHPKAALPSFQGAILDDMEFESLLRLTALSEALRCKSAKCEEKQDDAGPKGKPTHEEIELRAYHIYLGRGGAHGHEAEDWMRARRELLDKNTADRRPGKS